MELDIEVVGLNGNLKIEVPDDFTVMCLKVIVAEKLNLMIEDNNIDHLKFICNKKICEDDTLISYLFPQDNKITLFLPRSIRISSFQKVESEQSKSSFLNGSNKNNKYHFPDISLITSQHQKKFPPFDSLFQKDSLNFSDSSEKNHNADMKGMKDIGDGMMYKPLKPESPLHSLLEEMTENIKKVILKEEPFVNPWKKFLSENNSELSHPSIKRDFDIASKLTQAQTRFVCEMIFNKKKPLTWALRLLEKASYDVDNAWRMAAQIK
ncbi:hypothetical protein TRFO_17955 [Tritrichomonas foetus]|uniref:Ubiquitin-like domain-containing protein n=1 Tax=Tritrichomonas foetus TaxID=1144522 RepID=A0A1J4KLT3_9EUKA|nr:hypothetical protein TRFO_17955 [Tritrichomonas foetus]|eukprot:OHT12271.1 hypothetical protein TRFO_17955 [Tritrichomonas foetus]